MANKIKIIVNGEDREMDTGSNLADLVTTMGLSEKVIVVERNREIVPRREYPHIVLAEGDVLEIVHLVGGG